MTTKEKSPIVDTNSEDELEKLRIANAELERRLEDAAKPSNDVRTKIQQDEYISVMSLLPYTLNLSTEAGGQGHRKKFTKFGEIKKVLYSDLVEMLDRHTNFTEAGYFYILDPRVIRQHGLDEAYEKILSREKIEEVLATNSDASVDLYNSANVRQQEVIIDLFVEKVRDNPGSVNLNIVDKISRISKIDIVAKAESSKANRLAREEQKQ